MIGHDFLAFASKIVVLHPQPAAMRSAISRAYDGAFHLAVQLLHELSLKTDATHGSVWMDFMTPQDIESQAIGKHLQELHAYRVAADYQLDRQDVEEAELAIVCTETANHVASLVSTLRKLLQEDKARAAFVQTIQQRRQLTGRKQRRGKLVDKKQHRATRWHRPECWRFIRKSCYQGRITTGGATTVGR